jgi:hypothetical protein
MAARDRRAIRLRGPDAAGGATTSYKRRIGADTSHRAGARAFAIGAGIVNWGEHALIEGH